MEISNNPLILTTVWHRNKAFTNEKCITDK